MVQGIEKFRESFGDYNDCYVIIGGTACDIVMKEYGSDFRATKDIDLVMLVEAIDETFVSRFLSFVEEAEYDHIKKSSGERQFYRFENPKDDSFPKVIELFCRRPDYLGAIDTNLASIHISDNVSSLSAILLNDDYYDLLSRGRVVIDGLSVLNIESLILFKMKAWMDLSERRQAGESVDMTNIKKHKNDVIRLALNIEPDSHIIIKGSVKEDAQKFIELISDDKPNMKNLGFPRVSFKDVLSRLKECYGLD